MPSTEQSPAATSRRQTPSVLFLIAVNALVLFGVTTIGISDPSTFMVTLLLLFLPLFLFALAGQGVVVWLTKRRPVGDGTRAFLFLLPVILVVLASPFLAPAIQGRGEPPPLTSPSGEYILEIPIQRSAWMIRIRTKEGELLHDEAVFGFYGRFNSYWAWDEADRVWWFNADTAEVFFWERVNGEWRRERWGIYGGRETDRAIEPPGSIWPPHLHF